MLPSNPVGLICTPLCCGKVRTWRGTPITVSCWKELKPPMSISAAPGTDEARVPWNW